MAVGVPSGLVMLQARLLVQLLAPRETVQEAAEPAGLVFRVPDIPAMAVNVTVTVQLALTAPIV